MTDTERLDWLQKLDGDIYLREGYFEVSIPDDDAEGPHDMLVSKGTDLRAVLDEAHAAVG